MNLEIVHVGAVGMDIGADGMPGAMNEIFSEAGLFYMSADRSIDFPSSDLTFRGDSFLHGLHSGVARLRDDLEYLAHTIRWGLAHGSRPRNIVVHSVGRILLGPDIQQDEIALTDGGRSLFLRLVMRVAAVGIHGNDGRVVRNQIFTGESLHEPVLNVTLGCAAIADAATDLLEGGGGDGVNRIARSKVSLDLLLGPGSFELRHQVTGTDHVLAQPADHFQRAAVHQRNVEDQVVRRILHGDVAKIR